MIPGVPKRDMRVDAATRFVNGLHLDFGSTGLAIGIAVTSPIWVSRGVARGGRRAFSRGINFGRRAINYVRKSK